MCLSSAPEILCALSNSASLDPGGPTWTMFFSSGLTIMVQLLGRHAACGKTKPLYTSWSVTPGIVAFGYKDLWCQMRLGP
ncbi:hypothetical protein M378DRAFT_813529 [Amanita muscaria Koide BX008]|uniref:Uncharacterized protein n=1 Tax=Amanita muscaria (strain Koide BX008) TaxID=946122 RepID=A0A0C2WK05_AMAMK|nr:hypothetical protein M378DRAFT_813529 [Amanita muscaria Koide BX008]